MRLSAWVPLLFVVAIFMPGGAHAAPVTDVFNPPDVLFDNNSGTCTGTNNVGESSDSVSGFTNNKCTSLSYSHLLTGYDDALHTLLSATLTLFLYDDNSPSGDILGTPERYDLTLDGTLVANGQTITSGSTSSSPSTLPAYDVFARVEPDGQLSVVLSWDQGDFMFAKSELTADWERTQPSIQQAVPEPASLLLFGTGLAAAVRAARRRRAQA